MGKKSKNFLLEAIVNLFTTLPKGKVLDLGCGDGDYAKRLKDLGFDVIAGDIDIARFRYKKEIEFKFENVSIHTIIEYAIETIDIQVQQRNGTIRLNLDASEPMVFGDSEHLINLVSNLLDNAIKYSPDSPEICVSTNNCEKGIILNVEDKGIGMTKAVQNKIFERFYRQSSGNVHDVKGFGLGLNYARAIIDAHKGNIIVFSEPGKGSRFEIFIPFNCEN